MEIPSYLKLLPKESQLRKDMLHNANQYIIQTFVAEKFRDPAQFANIPRAEIKNYVEFIKFVD
jgi:hypothetical protein